MRPLTTDAPKRFSKRNDLATIRTLLPYLWPKGSANMRARVVIAIGLLVAAKGINVVAPILFKFAVDALAGKGAAILVVPIALLAGYGLARVLSLAFGELRDAV